MSEKKQKTTPKVQNNGFAFEQINYQLFIASIVVVAIGFFLMSGSEDIYSFTKITLAPLVVVLGFALGFVSILYKPKNNKAQD
ncbi:MAG: DUF3098 domain-containing protein [Sphingobacterium sp.]|uniref:DUF3098 domain-containing protein n=1 Tax=Sphingobacterium sp. JB170 TaxID=1434842 RepID=UPI00097F06A4|nr:DUF3098 domain-containing protein [Sphingobacterium sp. JB170]SJN48609.1 hypothetical protein FM107_17480 [Sphingobacterium sp. JB170]